MSGVRAWMDKVVLLYSLTVSWRNCSRLLDPRVVSTTWVSWLPRRAVLLFKIITPFDRRAVSAL